MPLCKSAGTKELKVVHGASATCVLQNAFSGLAGAALEQKDEDRRGEAQALVDAGNSRNSPLRAWSATLAEAITHLIDAYQKVRPQEAPEILYRRILQNLYKEFRSPLSPMSDATATSVLTYLISTSRSINSEEFRVSFRIMSELLMINWQLPVAIGTLFSTTQIKTFIICLTHGIDITDLDMTSDPVDWQYTMNGNTFSHAVMHQKTRHENHVEDNRHRAMDSSNCPKNPAYVCQCRRNDRTRQGKPAQLLSSIRGVFQRRGALSISTASTHHETSCQGHVHHVRYARQQPVDHK